VKKIQTIAVDPGFGNTKIAGSKGELILQSAVASDGTRRMGAVAGLRSAQRPMLIEVEGGAFYVGPGAHAIGGPVQNLDMDRLSGTLEMRALLYGAFSKYRASGKLDVVVGLPIEPLMGEDAPATKRSVRRFLKGQHTWQMDGSRQSVEVGSVLVISQPVGAMFDYLLNRDGTTDKSREKVSKEEIGVLSVGMNTIELLVIQDGRPVSRFTSGQTLGVRRLLRLADREELYTLVELDDQLRRKTLNLSEALPTWEREVLGQIEQSWGKQFRRFATIIAAGGGVGLLRRALSGKFGAKMYIPDEPIIATARGMRKFVLMKERAKRK
jgi:hypothetical protein